MEKRKNGNRENLESDTIEQERVMIRYVLVLVLATTILGMTATGLDHVGEARGQQAIETEVETVADAALELFELETLSPNSTAPQRLVRVELPEESLTKDRVKTLRFERIDGTEATRVIYGVEGQPSQETKIAVPIQHADGGAVEMSHWRGTQQFRLTLVADETGEPVVAIEPYP